MIFLLLAAAAEQREAGDAALLDKLGPPIGGGRWRCAPPCLTKRCPHVTAEAVRLLGFIAVAAKQPRQALSLSRVAVESTAAGTVRYFKRSTAATSGPHLRRKYTGLGPFLHNRSGGGEGFADSHRGIGLFKAERRRRRKSCVHARPNMGEIDGAAAEQAFATALSLAAVAVAGEAVVAARRTLFLQISRRWRTVDSATL